MDPGTKLGPYEILEPLGAGGMGEVYLAEDARLGRRVALKVLPAQFARDPERLARFEQEAKVLAALNHPNIAQVFGLEHAEAPVIVMELVDGEDLSQLLAGRPLPLDEVLPIARQIAKALGAAHEAGIVHRDLKPANILVRPDGVVKVLDFGLAKTVVGASGSGSGLADSPTIMSPVMTATGMIMGTAAYMAPEQAKGRPVDRRADVWAFGCVLYEMLVGRRPFGGDDVAEVMASVIKDAADLDALPDDTPAPIRRLLARCLKKDPADRLDSMAAVRLEIEDAEIAAPFQTGRAMASRNRPLPLLGAAGTGLIVGVLLWSVLSPEFALMNNLLGNASNAGEVVRLSIPLGADGPIALGGQPPVAVAISPDGAQIVYVVTEAGENVLYLRRLDEPEARPIPGTERGHGPFFSPDGEWLGFFADGKLKTVSLAGGAPVELAGAATARGATVTADGRIIFTPTINSGLWAVSISGGEPQELTQFDAEAGEFGHRWPHALPDGNTVLFVIDRGGSFDEARIGLLSLDTGETREIIDGGTCPVYLPTGHVVYARGGALLAVLFDLETGEILGRPTVVLTDVATQQDTGAGHFALSATGILVYIPGGAQTNERVIVNIDFDGAVAPIANLPARAYQQPSLAPDGTRLAVNIVEGTHDIWIAELGRGALTRLTFRGDNHSPLWSPDGQKVAFGSERGGPLSLFWIAADGSAEEEELLTGENSLVPNSWSPDGKLLAYTEIHPSTRGDVWVLSMDGERTAQAFLVSEHHEREAAFSPDGTLLAYVSDEAGRDGVYVQPYPGPGRKLQVSTEGGNQPVWSPDGGTLYYRNGDRMMAVRVNAETLSAEAPRQLFEERLDEGYIYNPRIYDVTIDGSGFIAVKREGDSSVTQVNVVLNWFEELKQRVPTGR